MVGLGTGHHFSVDALIEAGEIQGIQGRPPRQEELSPTGSKRCCIQNTAEK